MQQLYMCVLDSRVWRFLWNRFFTRNYQYTKPRFRDVLYFGPIAGKILVPRSK